MSQVTITVINPHSGASVERDASGYTQRDIEVFATRMDDAEAYACECNAEPAEWISNMVAKLGQVRAGVIILS